MMTSGEHWAIMPFIDCETYTEKALEDLQDQGLKVLLIDNGSADAGLLRRSCGIKWGKNVHTWRHAPPLPSLAATWNRALDFVWTTKADRALVVNNDVRLHKSTYEALHWAMDRTGAWFVSGVGVKEADFDPTIDLAALPRDHGGPDFSCFLISEHCHKVYRFDENFVPAYFEDNDYHRRMELDGRGEKIFGIPVPFLHYGSVTINRTPEAAKAFSPKFERCREYYVKKWGGLPGQETFEVPFEVGF